MLPKILLPRNTPQDEIEHYSTVRSKLTNLEWMAREFRDVLALFEHCQSILPKDPSEIGRPFGPDDVAKYMREFGRVNGWPFVPAKLGAFVLYNFRHGITSAGQAISRSPTLSASFSKPLYEFAKWKFRGRFPDWEDVRNAFGHAGEIGTEEEALKGPMDKEGIRIESPDARVFVGSHLNGCRLSTSFGQKLVTYDLNTESLDRLWLCTGAVFASLEGECPNDEREITAAAKAKVLKEFL